MQHNGICFSALEIYTKLRIYYAVDLRKSNIDFDAASLRQMLSKQSKIKHTCEEVCAVNKRGKFDVKTKNILPLPLLCWGIFAESPGMCELVYCVTSTKCSTQIISWKTE